MTKGKANMENTIDVELYSALAQLGRPCWFLSEGKADAASSASWTPERTEGPVKSRSDFRQSWFTIPPTSFESPPTRCGTRRLVAYMYIS